MRPAFHYAETPQLVWCSTSAPSVPSTRLRSVTLAGNLLVCGFVLGLGTWSTFAPLESAAIAVGVVEAESSRKTVQHLEASSGKFWLQTATSFAPGKHWSGWMAPGLTSKSKAFEGSSGMRRREKDGCSQNSTATSACY